MVRSTFRPFQCQCGDLVAAISDLTVPSANQPQRRDTGASQEQCKAVFMLGDVSSEFEGYRGLTVREVMDNMKTQVEVTIARWAAGSLCCRCKLTQEASTHAGGSPPNSPPPARP
jgi:hypothetical protein